MPLIVRNKNKYIYIAKSKIASYVYHNHFMRNSYLRIKELIIKNSFHLEGNTSSLFKKVFIETVSYCNNDCVFCPASSKVQAKSPDNFMSDSLYAKILDELAEVNFSGSIAFHCNNEPLLDERLSDWIKKARNILRRNFFYLYTNGILINTELSNRLFESGLNRIIINNYNNKYELIPSLKNLVLNSSLLKGEVIINYRLKDEYLRNRAGESPSAVLSLKEPLRIICIRPSMELVIGYDGTVPLCCADALWRTVMGNIKESHIKDIWFSSSLTKVRNSLLKGERNCIEICKVCDSLQIPAFKGTRN